LQEEQETYLKFQETWQREQREQARRRFEEQQRLNAAAAATALLKNPPFLTYAQFESGWECLWKDLCSDAPLRCTDHPWLPLGNPMYFLQTDGANRRSR